MRYTNIQLLRVVAAVGVVLYHLTCHGKTLIWVDPYIFRFPWFAGFPVPLFFAVSGFVLTHAIRSAPPGRFLFARFLRLYPGYWLALIGVMLLMRMRVYTEEHRWLIKLVNANAVSLWPTRPGRAVYLLGIEWSLVYEVFLSVALAGMSLFGARRGVPILAAIWLGVIAAKVVIRPDYASDQFPHWSTIALSTFNIPFLLGVLVYQVKDVGRRWRWPVMAITAVPLVYLPLVPMSMEMHWCNCGVGAAGILWLAVQFRQVSEKNPLARAGDWTYGLYLFHVPLIFAVLYPASRLGGMESQWALFLAGVVAIGGGLAFGMLESALHLRLRPLAKLRATDVRAWLARTTIRIRLAVSKRPVSRT